MPGYTLKSLKDAEDLAPKFGLDGVEARFATGLLDLEKLGLSYQRLGPGVRIPFGHTHAQQEEVYVVMSGSARAKLDDEIVQLGTLDAIRVAGEVMRAFEAGPEGVEILAIGAPLTAPGDADMVPGWWAD